MRITRIVAAAALLAACHGRQASAPAPSSTLDASPPSSPIDAPVEPAPPTDASVQARIVCPAGTSVQVDTFEYAQGTKRGHIEWCELPGGPRHGPWRAWWEDGAPKTQGTYEEGRKQGIWVEYFLTGRVSEEETYDRDERHGTWRRYWGDGSLASEETFDHGACVGTVTYYEQLGKVSERGQCVDGQLHGDWTSYSPSGVKTRIIHYVRGTAVRQLELRRGTMVRVPVEGVPPVEPPEPPAD